MDGPGRQSDFDPKRFPKRSAAPLVKGGRLRSARLGGHRKPAEDPEGPQGGRDGEPYRVRIRGLGFEVWVAADRAAAAEHGLPNGEDPVYLLSEDEILGLTDGTDEEREAIRSEAHGKMPKFTPPKAAEETFKDEFPF